MANMTQGVDRPTKYAEQLQQYGLVGYTNYQGGSAAWTAYKGGVAVMDVSDVDGYAQKKISSVNAAADDVFLGVFAETVAVTASDAADGAQKARVWRDGIHAFAKNGLAATDIGAPAYASDDQTITTTSSNNLWIGYIVDVDATYVWVDITRAAGMANSAT